MTLYYSQIEITHLTEFNPLVNEHLCLMQNIYFQKENVTSTERRITRIEDVYAAEIAAERFIQNCSAEVIDKINELLRNAKQNVFIDFSYNSKRIGLLPKNWAEMDISLSVMNHWNSLCLAADCLLSINFSAPYVPETMLCDEE